jgi:MFS family permease
MAFITCRATARSRPLRSRGIRGIKTGPKETRSHNVTTLLIFGGVIGAGAGIFLSANWALATDLIPQEETGKYLGLTNLATAGSGAVGRLAGPPIDGVNALRPGAYLGYPTLFVLASLSVVIGTLVVLRIREPVRPR